MDEIEADGVYEVSIFTPFLVCGHLTDIHSFRTFIFGITSQSMFPNGVVYEGLNNIGCLVRTAGKITAVGSDWFYISDGTPLDDGAGYDGVYVHTPDGVVRPNINKKVVITGISTGSVIDKTSIVRRVLIPRRQSDITVLK